LIFEIRIKSVKLLRILIFKKPTFVIIIFFHFFLEIIKQIFQDFGVSEEEGKRFSIF